MKARNIVIFYVINYLLLLLVSLVFEIGLVSNKAQRVTSLMQVAGDMALEQTQVSDDFFTGQGYRVDTNPYKIKMPSATGNGYVETPIFTGLYGLNMAGNYGKSSAYSKLFVESDFKDFTRITGNIRYPLRSWNDTKSGLSWYTIPKLLYTDDSLLYPTSALDIKTAAGGGVSTNAKNYLIDTYGFRYIEKRSGNYAYYNTPISLGVTYINKDMLGMLFMNNLDLLMRSKYGEKGTNLNSINGGSGIIKGNFYKDRVEDPPASWNTINDGYVSLVRGQQIASSSSSVKAFGGITPTVTYKVIDMYDSSCDSLLSVLFGVNKRNATTGITYASKAQYLKSLDTNVKNPMTLAPYDHKYIVVAEVTFYADFIVPISMLSVKDVATTTKYMDIKRDYTSVYGGVMSPYGTGNRLVAYTRYFAVTP